MDTTDPNESKRSSHMNNSCRAALACIKLRWFDQVKHLVMAHTYNSALNTKLRASLSAFRLALSEASVYFWLDMSAQRSAEGWGA